MEKLQSLPAAAALSAQQRACSSQQTALRLLLPAALCKLFRQRLMQLRQPAVKQVQWYAMFPRKKALII
jgi:hypothetical protein